MGPPVTCLLFSTMPRLTLSTCSSIVPRPRPIIRFDNDKEKLRRGRCTAEDAALLRAWGLCYGLRPAATKALPYDLNCVKYRVNGPGCLLKIYTAKGRARDDKRASLI